MTKWLDRVFQEIKSIDPERFRPQSDIGFGDHVLGEADERHKKLYALAEKYKRNADKIAQEAMTAPFITRSSKKVLIEEARAEKQRACILMGIFYESIRDLHDLWGEDIDIKKGWKIVRVRIDEVPNRVSFFADTPFKEVL